MTSAIQEGCIRVSVTAANGCVQTVQVDSTRPTGLGAVFRGRPVEDALRLVPRLFSLCAVAQQVAALSATETALGITVAPAQNSARQVLVNIEALEQTLWRIQLGWPRFFNMASDVVGYKRLRHFLQPIKIGIFAEPDGLCLGGARLKSPSAELQQKLAAAEEAVFASLFACSSKRWPLDDVKTFMQWLHDAPTIPARVLSQVYAEGLTGFGKSTVALLTALNPAWLERRLAAPDAAHFCAQPEFQGQPLETGALARCATQPIIADLLAKHGNGLFARLAAQLMQIKDLFDVIRDHVRHLNGDEGQVKAVKQNSSGVSIVRTARGLLAQRISVSENHILDYQILAPTEWNFHPRGALAEGLQGAAIGVRETAERYIGLLVAALDPCVDYQVLIEET